MLSRYPTRSSFDWKRHSTVGIDAVNTPSGSKPGSTWDTAARLRSSRPVITTSTVATAICPTTRPDGNRLAPRRSVGVAPNEKRDVWRAGMRPNMTPISVAAPRPNANAIPFTATSARRGVPGGARATSPSSMTMAASIPTAAPRIARTRLSVRNCLKILPLPPPSDALTATSLRRCAARAVRSPATLSPTTTNTARTEAKSTQMGARASPMMKSSIRRSSRRSFSYLSGCASARPRAVASISAAAISSVTSGPSLATAHHPS